MKKLIRKSRKSEQGVAILEAVLALPILLIFTIGVIDLGNWLSKHYAASRIAYEASRAAAGLADLSEPVMVDGLPCISNLDDALLQNEQGHYIVLTRINRLLVAHDIPLEGVTYKSCLYADTNSVYTEVEIPFKPLFSLFINQNDWYYKNTAEEDGTRSFLPSVKASAVAPYLYH